MVQPEITTADSVSQPSYSNENIDAELEQLLASQRATIKVV